LLPRWLNSRFASVLNILGCRSPPGYPGWLLVDPPGSLKERLSAKRLKELAAEAPGTEEPPLLVVGI